MESYSVKNLTFRYAGAAADILTDISFSVEKGEFVTICGLSGSGKSTLLRQLKTCLQPFGERSGEILFEGKPLNETDFRTQSAKIGFVQQSPDHQSITDKVWHELAFGLESLGCPRDVIQRRTAETASFFGMEKWYEKPIAELSGGQKQILNIASVMVMQPSVLILDEPTAQLDPIAAHELLNWLQRINRELSVTIILSEHNLEEVCAFSDRLLVMSGGKIISDTSPQKTSGILYQQHDPVFLSLPSPTRIYEYAEKLPDHKPPLSAAQGREWLQNKLNNMPQKAQSEPVKEISADNKAAPYISIKNLWFRYEKNGPDVLKGCTLDIRKGEFLAILGGNGTGKTTLFSVLSALNRPLRGTVTIDNTRLTSQNAQSFGIAMLPQNPQTLFVEATVKDDLYEILKSQNLPKSEQEKRLRSIISLCGLHNLLQSHPYDLSGGEQQKAALAKLLLTKPKILLLDEPTKGLDCAFRLHLADIIKELTKNGTTVIAVSHDMDFCAAYADRCGMLFNGRMVSIGTPKEFFSENGLYTTAVCRMSKGLIPKAVTVTDVLDALKIDEGDNIFTDSFKDNGQISEKQKSISVSDETGSDALSLTKNKHDNVFRVLSGIITITLTVLFMLSTTRTIYLPFFSEHIFLNYAALVLSAIMFMLCVGKREIIPVVRCRHSTKRSLIAVMTIFLLIPFTIYIGVNFLDDSKYLFISLLILLESILPFYLMFEKRTIQTRELVLTAVLCAMCVAGRAVFYMLPECKPVTAIVILSAVALGSESGFMIGSVSMLASNIIFGQGIWTPWQMVTMGLIGYLTGVVFHRSILPPTKRSVAVFGFISVFIIYGGIMNPATLILSHSAVTPESLLYVYAVGLPLDTVHAISTAAFLYIGAEPLLTKLERIKKKYGLIR